MPTLLSENFINHQEFNYSINQDSLLLKPCSYEYLNIDPEDYSYSVKYYFHKLKKKNIIFNDFLESPRTSYFHFLNTFGKKLLDDLSLDPAICRYMTGAAPTIGNTNYYNNLVTQHKLIPIPITYSNHFEYNFSSILNCDYPPVFLEEKVIKPNKFLFLAGSQRFHRVWLLLQFIKQDILKNCQYTFFSDKRIIIEKMNIGTTLFPYEDTQIIKDTNFNIPSFINVKPDDWFSQHQLTQKDVEIFNNSYVSIVAETTFFPSTYNNKNFYSDQSDYHFNFHFLTEKTYRAIALKHPFILASLPHTLSALKELGYKTFSPFIDESYDEVIDDKERLYKILSTIQTLNAFTDQQWIEFYYNTREIVEYNYNLMKSRNFVTTL